MISLEQEANETIQMHKYAILVKRVKQFYMDYYLSNNTVFIYPETAESVAHNQARKEVRELYIRDKKEYDKQYEKAWWSMNQ